MEPEKTEMLQRFLTWHTPVKEIMVPAIDIIMLNANATIKDALAIFCKISIFSLAGL